MFVPAQFSSAQFINMDLLRLSVPFTAPTPKYMSLEDVVRHYEDFSYQLYLSNDESTAEIESNVGLLISITWVPLSCYFCQLKQFFRLLFTPSAPGFSKKELLREYVRNDKQLDPSLPCLLNNDVYHTSLSHVIPFDEFVRNCIIMSRNLSRLECMARSHTIAPARLGTMKRGNVSRTLSIHVLSLIISRVYRSTSEVPKPTPFPSHFPVLLLWGTEDTTCARFLIKKAYEQIPHMHDQPCQGKGHWLMIESSDEVTNNVLEWLSAKNGKDTRQRL